MGYEVFHHTYEYGGRTFENLEVVLRGRVHPEEIVVVGGHYDTVEGTPGAAILYLTQYAMVDNVTGWNGLKLSALKP